MPTKVVCHIAKRYRGFTLLEILIVVAVIALLAIMAIPAYQRTRMRSQAVMVKEDLWMIENSLTQYAVENIKPNGATVTFVALKPYIKDSSRLYMTGADLFGNPFGPIFTVGLYPSPSASTYQALTDVADDAFWAPFGSPP